MSAANVEQIRRGYEAFNRRDIDAALEGFSPEIVWVGPTMLPEGEREFHGHEGVLRFWNMWHETFEEFRVEIEETIDAGERVMAMVRIHARHRGSGAEVVNPSFPHVWTIHGGEVVRLEMYPNRATALEALGLTEKSA